MALWGKRDSKTASGTVTIGTDGAVVGSSTSFTTQARIGNCIRVSGIDYVITTITDNTHCTVTSGVNGGTITAQTGASYTLSEKPAFVAKAESHDNGFGGSGDSRKVFGVNATEVSAGGDDVAEVAIVNGGSGYVEAPSITFDSGAQTATATISNGAVSTITITGEGSYDTPPAVTIQRPVLTVATANVNTTTESIAYTAHGQAVAAALTYQDGGGTAATGLTDNTTYYVSEIGRTANAFRLAASSGAATAATIAGGAVSGTAGQFTCTATSLAANDRVVITGTLTGTATITGYTTGTIYKVSAVTGTSPNVTGFTLTAEDGTAVVSTAGTITGLTLKSGTLVNISGTGNNDQYFEIVAGVRATAQTALGSGAGGTQVTHSGWVRRTVGTGGRAGRIFYETLVANGTTAATSGDQADDVQFHDV